MEVRSIPRIAGGLLFTPTPHADERGFFTRTFDADIVRVAGFDPTAYAQDSISRSARFDVVVDLRPGSPTFRNWESFELSGDSQVSLSVAAGCAHGFQAPTDPADTCYRIDRPHDTAEDMSIAFADPELDIPWPLPVSVMSARERPAMPLTAAIRLLQ